MPGYIDTNHHLHLLTNFEFIFDETKQEIQGLRSAPFIMRSFACFGPVIYFTEFVQKQINLVIQRQRLRKIYLLLTEDLRLYLIESDAEIWRATPNDTYLTLLMKCPEGAVGAICGNGTLGRHPQPHESDLFAKLQRHSYFSLILIMSDRTLKFYRSFEVGTVEHLHDLDYRVADIWPFHTCFGFTDIYGKNYGITCEGKVAPPNKLNSLELLLGDTLVFRRWRQWNMGMVAVLDDNRVYVKIGESEWIILPGISDLLLRDDRLIGQSVTTEVVSIDTDNITHYTTHGSQALIDLHGNVQLNAEYIDNGEHKNMQLAFPNPQQLSGMMNFVPIMKSARVHEN